LPHSDYDGSYSPDGREVIFESDRRYDDYCCSDLFVVPARGGGIKRIHLPFDAYQPRWGTAPLVSPAGLPSGARFGRMEAAAWSAIALVAALSMGTLFYLGSRFDGLAARLDGLGERIDSIAPRFDNLAERIDGVSDSLSSRIDAMAPRCA
jgi:hypothetical protein